MSVHESHPVSQGNTSGSNRKIKVMIVDDSAVIRGALARIIEDDPVLEIVGSMSNGKMAVSASGRVKPHIVILDIEMPVMSGLEALPKILEASPRSKVIMFSSLTEKGASITLKAFALGAVECIVKPTTSQQVGRGSEFQNRLLDIIKNLAGDLGAEERESVSSARANTNSRHGVSAKALPVQQSRDAFALYDDTNSYKGKPAIIAIGSSTGGPKALFAVLSDFKGFNIPIIITQHMPATFTKILAEHIEQQTGITAHEGGNGMVIQGGHIYVAPGKYHMYLEKRGVDTIIRLGEDAPVNFCKPSVDPMFESAIKIYGQRVLGVILTGMGSDGLDGSSALVKAGGRLIAQDKQSSVVWGMPGAVATAGICSAVLPLKDIGPWVKRAVL